MASVPYEMWVDYYDLLLLKQGIDPKTILDACCGTGTVAEMLYEKGFEVTGFDLSAEMIDQAKSKAAERELDIHYFVADATTFEVPVPFDAACSFFDSLNYITTLQGLQDAIRQVGKALKPGGSWIFDVNTEYAFQTELFTQSDVRKNTSVKYDWVGKYDPESKIIQVDMLFWKGEQEFREVHIQRAHSHDEILAALKESGFENVESYNAYTLDKPTSKSDRIFYACTKS